MNKKVISAALAGVMALSTMGTSVFAADKVVKTAGATTYKITGTLAAPEINVTLPGAVSAVVNPYGVSFEMKGQTYGAQGVTSPIYTIKNNTMTSAVAVNVVATITAPLVDKKDEDGKVVKDEDGKAVKVAAFEILTDTDATDDNIKTKEGEKTKALYAKIAGIASASAPDQIPGYVDAEDSSKNKPNKKLFKVGDTDRDDGVKDITFADGAVSTPDAEELMVIPKAVGTTTKEGTKVVTTYTKIGWGQFQLGGNVTSNKAKAWTSTDKVAINLILDISPAAEPTT